MTTIAAKKKSNGKIEIAWDSQATLANTATHNTNKVRLVNNQFAVGCTGSARYANVIHRATIEKFVTAEEFDAEGWMIDTLVPAWARAIQRAGEFDSKNENPEGSSIVVIAGTIFEVGEDFGVTDMGDYGSAGSGTDFALTAMHLGKSARVAVEIASQLDLYTGGEIKGMTL